MLVETSDKSMPEQKDLLSENFKTWIGYLDKETGSAYHQVDDVCVMGIKV